MLVFLPPLSACGKAADTEARIQQLGSPVWLERHSAFRSIRDDPHFDYDSISRIVKRGRDGYCGISALRLMAIRNRPVTLARQHLMELLRSSGGRWDRFLWQGTGYLMDLLIGRTWLPIAAVFAEQGIVEVESTTMNEGGKVRVYDLTGSLQVSRATLVDALCVVRIQTINSGSDEWIDSASLALRYSKVDLSKVLHTVGLSESQPLGDAMEGAKRQGFASGLCVVYCGEYFPVKPGGDLIKEVHSSYIMSQQLKAERTNTVRTISARFKCGFGPLDNWVLLGESNASPVHGEAERVGSSEVTALR